MCGVCLGDDVFDDAVDGDLDDAVHLLDDLARDGHLHLHAALLRDDDLDRDLLDDDLFDGDLDRHLGADDLRRRGLARRSVRGGIMGVGAVGVLGDGRWWWMRGGEGTFSTLTGTSTRTIRSRSM